MIILPYCDRAAEWFAVERARTSRNYLRRQAILSSARVIYGTGCEIFW